jgi:16S rRNA (uracil1498-N3)-methyltransferase
MNLLLLPPQAEAERWCVEDPRQLQHLRQQLKVAVGDRLKVGILNHKRYDSEVVAVEAERIWLRPLAEQALPAKLPITLIVALPRPKVLRRLVMDSVTLGVQRLVLMHSYRVDKSYWQTPFLQQLKHYVQLGLEQAGDVVAPDIALYQRFKPFVEDHLAQGHPYAEHSMPRAFNQPCQLLIGPEGGFIPYELELLGQNGCQLVSVGSRILRTETAVPYLLSRLFG